MRVSSAISLHVTVVTCLLGALTSSATLTFSNHGYENFVVAIADSVPEDQTMIDEIKSMMTSASAYLFNATRHNAYFRSVRILVPGHWARGAGWEDRKEESVAGAEVRVEGGSPLYGDTPYTFQPGQCGEPGRYVHLTPRLLTDTQFREQNFGDAGRLLVHEFAHLRFGVFDEYGFGDTLYPYFYLNDRNEVKATGCSAEVKGVMGTTDRRPCSIDPGTGLPDSKCLFYPSRHGNGARASIMFQQAVDSVTQFCEEGQDEALRHERNAPNQQNALCGGVATWEVISRHPDFRNFSSNQTVQYAQPNFTVVQDRGGNSTQVKGSNSAQACARRGVLVLDTSGSMTEKRMLRQNQASAAFINGLPRGARLAIVSFSDSAVIVSRLRSVGSESDKIYLRQQLPRYSSGGTSIGSGLQLALYLLRDDGGDLREDYVYVITDGEENTAPEVKSVLPELQQSGVQVHTLAYSDQASQMLATLSTRTGGLYFYFDEDSASTALFSASDSVLQSITTCKEDVRIELDRSAFSVSRLIQTSPRYVFVDESMNNNLTFTFFGSQYLQFEAYITDPSGRVYNVSSPEYSWDSDLDIVTVLIPSPQSGLWSYQGTGSNSGWVVGVVSSRAGRGVSAVEVESWMGSRQASPAPHHYAAVYAHLHQGYAPLVGADVTAVVTRPSGASAVTLTLKDDGLRPDSLAGDGVYTAYFLDYSRNGRYSVDVSVTSVPGVTALVRLASQSGALPLSPVAPPAVELQPVANISRTSTAGAFDASSVSGRDVIPPGVITDLRLVAVDATSRSATLAWTSPGDDFRSGNVTAYDIRIGRSFDQLTLNFSGAVNVTSRLLLSGDLGPSVGGESKEVKVKLQRGFFPWNESTYVIGVKASDDVPLISDLSNLVVVTFDPVTYPENMVLTPESPQTGSSGILVYVIGIASGVVVLGIIVIVVVIVIVRRRRKERNAEKRSAGHGVRVNQAYIS